MVFFQKLVVDISIRVWNLILLLCHFFSKTTVKASQTDDSILLVVMLCGGFCIVRLFYQPSRKNKPCRRRADIRLLLWMEDSRPASSKVISITSFCHISFIQLLTFTHVLRLHFQENLGDPVPEITFEYMKSYGCICCAITIWFIIQRL